MIRPCRLGVCLHCEYGKPCTAMRDYLAREQEADDLTALPLARPDRPLSGSWFDRSEPYTTRSGFLVDDPINDGRF